MSIFKWKELLNNGIVVESGMFEFVFECSSVVSISLDGILSTLGCCAQGGAWY